ncbi:MAG: pilus assembly protein [Alphaproteobacteria bacterium]|nr:pilus assembly protein [Alphaproteobacteria bacterium]
MKIIIEQSSKVVARNNVKTGSAAPYIKASRIVRLPRLQAFIGSRSGASAVEFAVIAPAFILMLVGMLCYGLYFSTSHGVAQLAADAARASVAGLSATERTQIATTHVRERAGDYMFIDATKVVVDAGPSQDDATQFKIAVRYDASALPIWVFSGLLPLPERNIVKVASIKTGGF